MISASGRNFAKSVGDHTILSRSSILTLCRPASRLANVLLPEPELPKTRTLMVHLLESWWVRLKLSVNPRTIGKRQGAAAVQDAVAMPRPLLDSARFWSAAAPCRFRAGRFA